MNIAAVICDNARATVAHKTGTQGKEASEQSGEGSQPRFADVLPLAEVALEQPRAKEPAEKTPAQARSTAAKIAVDLPVKSDRPTRNRSKQGENVQADPQIVVWPFPGVAQPVAPRQAPVGSPGVQPAKGMKGQPTTEPIVFTRGPKAAEQASMPEVSVQRTADVRPTVVRGQQTKAVDGGQPAGVRDAASIVPNAATPKRQETALPAEPVGKQVPVVSEGPQEPKAAPVLQAAQAMAGGVQAEHADIRTERAQGAPGVRVVRPASQVNRQEAPAPIKPAPSGRPANVGEKVEQTPAKSQPLPPQPTGGSEPPPKPGRELQEQVLSTEGRQGVASKPAAPARREGPKVEAVQMDAKDTPSPGPKETGAAAPELRVLSTGYVTTTSQRPAAQPQSQTGVDVPPARSPVQSVGEQILDSMQAAAARGDRQLLVRLNPPELGTVLVRFQEQGDFLHGTVEVASREIRREIEQALPQVVRALQEAGVQIRRVEVVTSDQPERNLGGEHESQDVWQQHQGTGQGREHSQGSPQARWPQNAGGHNTIRQGVLKDEPRAAAAPGRIDVLL